MQYPRKNHPKEVPTPANNISWTFSTVLNKTLSTIKVTTTPRRPASCVINVFIADTIPFLQTVSGRPNCQHPSLPTCKHFLTLVSVDNIMKYCVILWSQLRNAGGTRGRSSRGRPRSQVMVFRVIYLLFSTTIFPSFLYERSVAAVVLFTRQNHFVQRPISVRLLLISFILRYYLMNYL